MTEPVTFVKGDQTRVADSVKEAVQLKFNGWQKQKPGQSAPVPDAPSEPAPEDAGEPQREYPTDH